MYCCVCATGIGKMEPGKACSSAVATYALSSIFLSSLSILTVLFSIVVYCFSIMC